MLSNWWTGVRFAVEEIKWYFKLSQGLLPECFSAPELSPIVIEPLSRSRVLTVALQLFTRASGIM